MKKTVMALIVSATILALSLSACGSSNTSSSGNASSSGPASKEEYESVAGGWETPASPELTSESKEALGKAAEDLSGASYIPVALLGTQVLSGTNYRILCREIHGTSVASETWAIITVYEDLEGNAEITDDEDSGNPTNISDDKETTGGWEQAESPVPTNDDLKAFDKAFGDADKGYEITPLAILSYQVVSGENYCFLATKDSDGAYTFAYFYEDLDGNVSDAYTVDFTTNDSTSQNSETSAVIGSSALQAADYPPCAKIDGTVYQDTGYVSSAYGCGNMDGEITSTVDGSEMPSEDDQSNFGTGYGYQLWGDGLILVQMNGEMEIFRDVGSDDTSIPDIVASFIGQVESIDDNTILLKYVGMPENSLCPPPEGGNPCEYTASSSAISGEVQAGDTVQVWYTGAVMETDPAQIDAYEIKKVDDSAAER